MANECTVDVISKPNHWLRIVQELLSQAGIVINGPEPWDIRVHDTRFFKRVLQQGSLGLGESYMEGWWDCKRLDVFFDKLLCARLDEQRPASFSDLLRIAFARLANPQSRKRAWQVGEVHYDLGNDLFNRMLDPHMQYSCGYWKEADELFVAQENKLALICEKLQLKPGMTMLDIGCGWGGLAEYAAHHYGVHVEGITISAEQKAYAEHLCAGKDVRILLQDYRDLDKQYDRIVSVGMFEHVGPKNYATYFKAVDHCLKPDGLFLLHSIGSNKTQHNVDAWINKYIFPNGCLPSLKQVAEASEPYFVIEDVHNFGADYDKTLMAWHSRFNKAWPQLSGNYSVKFHRMFNYYLTACAGAFRARNIQLWQLVLSRGVTGGLRVAR
ncbi:TPA: cyclopropane fatty acyl phospholipid synthase [Kluyvera intermedia]|uniref:Cyclopropane fatty acyl phospholipid synthase n=2 Tax=Enterobacteriaceae TaxID=543 RepID=A0AAC8QP89_9ENTR|nr:cyclopropane fatty acyl phospholipid synthase [Phytobacter ursingii]HAT2204723.1 cyclopropane fatty acyl phospholipid synthase [Kluyvera intermedia]AKL12343.1 cyclopropane fatty acyl phospholipid synthase [Phytobacter ursingii]HAT2515284.1 cyclopropane fatty acyl phospholipid synthase [Kluyvera intermedia]HAT2603049.1 cyclopropane fatty acyl phospholipid synthase [Kluyvera intermedia]HAT2679917.1 cyclopropane fatty acyl phospholipid synthase [Kluyvera intermedia]